ncbi:ATP-dependent DNA helicase UvrD2 [Fodinicola feengrottensis]|uniref:DNA 3'-5' helicase n=1 Tax=Fodinicola feengrottensis TaxID=435914 RepID=A0ABP4UM46_9ACTN
MSAVLAGLDEAQTEAVLAPGGPVCVLAGAGTGKTRTITHRIAYRSLTGETAARHVLAITFTARAAGEMRGRLIQLGVAGAQARTFHAAALRQLRYFAPRLFQGRPMPELLESKGRLVSQAALREGVRLAGTAVRDVTSEIEWAKAMMIEASDFPAAATKAERELPIDAAALSSVYMAYEQLKRRSQRIDFEDLLRAMVWALEEHPDVAEQIRSQYRHFVVDEYQDVNPLQQRLLEAWLGGREDLCVVGDASQTIYSFTGASADHLLGFARQRPGAVVVRLERDYRSTPQVVQLANQVIAGASGQHAAARLKLVGQRPDGPVPRVVRCEDETAEAEAVAARCAELITGDTPASEIAVLFRTNAQSELYEQALAERGVPYVVRGTERFFERPEVREAMILLRGAAHAAAADQPLVEAVTDALSGGGFTPAAPPPGGAARERWEALAALVRLASDAIAAGTVAGTAGAGLPAFNDLLAGRATAQHAPTVEGVTLASLHAAKGLEWAAVFLVGLTEGTMPISYAQTTDHIEEERRLLYVGITRAKERLWLSWAAARQPGGRSGRRPSRFLPTDAPEQKATRATSFVASSPAKPKRGLPTCRLCGVALFDSTQRKLRRCGGCPPPEPDAELFERLREWRERIAAELAVPPYLILTDASMTAVAEDQPDSLAELGEIPGMGPARLTRYGQAVLALVAGALPDSVPDPGNSTA